MACLRASQHAGARRARHYFLTRLSIVQVAGCLWMPNCTPTVHACSSLDCDQFEESRALERIWCIIVHCSGCPCLPSGVFRLKYAGCQSNLEAPNTCSAA
eukprot:UN3015